MSQDTWFITGIDSGFGRALTEQLLATGHRVAGTIRKPDSVGDLTARYGDRLWLPGWTSPTPRGSARSSTARSPTWAASTWSSTTPATASSVRPRNSPTSRSSTSSPPTSRAPSRSPGPSSATCARRPGDGSSSSPPTAARPRTPAPLRLVLGSDSHRFITTAPRERLAQIEPQAETAASTDRLD